MCREPDRVSAEPWRTQLLQTATILATRDVSLCNGSDIEQRDIISELLTQV